MSATREWFEPRTVEVGGEVSWQGGAFRFCLDSIELRRGLIDRWFGEFRTPAICNLSARLAMPTRPLFPCDSRHRFPPKFPLVWGPFYEDANTPLLAPNRGAAFEIVDLVEPGRAAIVRAGVVWVPSTVEVTGELGALDPAARRFVRAWLELPARQALASPRPLGYRLPPLPGYQLRLGPETTGSVELTFHRDGDRYFVRTYGGCVVPVEHWYGPYVERNGACAPAP